MGEKKHLKKFNMFKLYLSGLSAKIYYNIPKVSGSWCSRVEDVYSALTLTSSLTPLFYPSFLFSPGCELLPLQARGRVCSAGTYQPLTVTQTQADNKVLHLMSKLQCYFCTN